MIQLVTTGAGRSEPSSIARRISPPAGEVDAESSKLVRTDGCDHLCGCPDLNLSAQRRRDLPEQHALRAVDMDIHVNRPGARPESDGPDRQLIAAAANPRQSALLKQGVAQQLRQVGIQPTPAE